MQHFRRTVFSVFFFLSLLLACSVLASAAKTGLVTQNGHTCFYNEDGEMETDALITHNNKTYYFDENGWMVRKQLFQYDGGTYYADQSGAIAKNKFVTIGKKRYFFNQEGRRKTGWISYNEHTYYCPKNGAIYRNTWKKIRGKYYFFGSEYYIRKNRWVRGYYVDKNGIRVSKTAVTTPKSKVKTLRMTNFRQNPELPTGCESVSLAMLLKYKKFSIKKTTIAYYYLPTNGGSNFVTSFAGNPRSGGGCGIYAPGLRIAANKYLTAKKSRLKAYDLTGMDFSDLYRFIDSGDPVIVWNSMHLWTPQPSFSYFTLGRNWTFFRYEHCVVFCGYNKQTDKVLINDPLDGLVWRDRAAFVRIYNQMGKMALVIK
ncbi:MAG: C39 family peptidase [Eubacteriales bacterium]|nr:C39 family peptidase [Eubacteriales bacterium]